MKNQNDKGDKSIRLSEDDDDDNDDDKVTEMIKSNSKYQDDDWKHN